MCDAHPIQLKIAMVTAAHNLLWHVAHFFSAYNYNLAPKIQIDE